jgi:cell division protein ZapA (FtsZ GTPase activity inhibitor)
MKEKFYVEIAGVRLGIVSEEGKEHVDSVANAVNERITKMLKTQRNCSLVEAAIFCAMDFYGSGSTDGRKLKNLEAQIALYQANVNRLKKENEELRAKLAQSENNEE